VVRSTGRRAAAREAARAKARAQRRLGFAPTVPRVTVTIIAAVILLATGAGAAGRSWLDGALTQVSALDPQSPAVRNAGAQTGDENVVVLTTDVAASGTQPNPTAASLVIAHVPRDSDSVVALSLPADLEINRPPCERWDPTARTYTGQTVPAEPRTTLINAFEIGGPRCTTKTVQQLTGLAISRFVAVDRAGVATMARAVGVDPCPPGPPPGDAATLIERDHGQLRAVLSRTLSLAGLLSPTRVLGVHDALPSAVLADQIDLGRLLGIAQALDDLDADRITYAAAPVPAAPNVRGHSELRDGEANTLFRAVREDVSLPAPQVSRSASSTGSPSPGEVTVDVLNASGRDGLAAGSADRLKDLGYGVDEVGNAVDAADTTSIVFSPDRAAAAELLASSVPRAALVPEPAAAGVLELVLGADFDDVVRAPDEAAALTAAAPGCS
jgi:LCP family protein required for cell wall assembly